MNGKMLEVIKNSKELGMSAIKAKRVKELLEEYGNW
jgi:hypothetical protein